MYNKVDMYEEKVAKKMKSKREAYKDKDLEDYPEKVVKRILGD